MNTVQGTQMKQFSGSMITLYAVNKATKHQQQYSSPQAFLKQKTVIQGPIGKCRQQNCYKAQWETWTTYALLSMPRTQSYVLVDMKTTESESRFKSAPYKPIIKAPVDQLNISWKDF